MPQQRAHQKAVTVAVIVLLAAVSIGISACGPTQPCGSISSPPPASPPPSRQTVLPISVHDVGGVAVDTAGNVYVIDLGCWRGVGFVGDRVVKLVAGSSSQTVLPFTGLTSPGGVAVDTAGNVYVTDRGSKRVLKLAAGSSAQTVLPNTGLGSPGEVAVDTAGNVYVTNSGTTVHENPSLAHRVVKLAAGSSAQTVLPFTGLNDPSGVAVDGAGNVYVADQLNNRVLKLAAGSSAQTLLPFTGLNQPRVVAVDSAGNVYVNAMDSDFHTDQIVKVAAG